MIRSVPVLLLLVLLGCNPAKEAFKSSYIDGALFSEIPGIAKAAHPNDPLSGMDSAHIYKVVLREQLVIDGNVVDYALLPENTTRATEDYIPVKSAYYEIYLFQFPAQITQSFPSIMPTVFLPVKYNADSLGIGFGNAYYGYGFWELYPKKKLTGSMQQDSSKRRLVGKKAVFFDSTYTVEFDTRLKMARDKESYAFRKKRDAEMVFVMDSLKHKEFIQLKKLVLAEHNKVSGDKRLIYPLHLVSGDSSGLRFEYLKSVPIKPKQQ